MRLAQELAGRSLERLSGVRIAKWLPTELPQVRNLGADLVGETADRELIQIEIQSANDRNIDLTMLQYMTGIPEVHKRFPRQIVLYIGRAPRICRTVAWHSGELRFTVLAVRELDSETFLASPEIGDSVFGY